MPRKGVQVQILSSGPIKMNPICRCEHSHRSHRAHRWRWDTQQAKQTGDPFLPISGSCMYDDCECRGFEIAEGMASDAV